MIVIPRETPVVNNLHTSYIKIRHLIDYFRTSLPSGCIHMRAPNSEGAVFFDGGDIVNAHLCIQGHSQGRERALAELIRTADEGKHHVSVFEISSETIGYWANLNEAALIRKNLSSSTVGLEALMKKITLDRFTGLIEVQNHQGRADQIHVILGEIVGAVLGKTSGILRDPELELSHVMRHAKNERTRIAIKRVKLDNHRLSSSILNESPPGETDLKETPSPFKMLESLLGTFEQTYATAKLNDDPFDTILKRKFLEKVSRYDFLDPFAAEFCYQDGAITYTGTDNASNLVAAVTECLRELALERGLGMDFQRNLRSWRAQFQHEIDLFQAVV